MSGPFDGGPHRITPLGPAAVVVANGAVAKQIRQHEPGVGGPFSNPAIHYDVFTRGKALLAQIDGAQLVGGPKAVGVGVHGSGPGHIAGTGYVPCLLYTSDAADERSSVDLGGRRIIKKK